MLVDARQLEPGALVEADVCIVGAGAAGITVARDLARAGVRVALLESGGLLPSAANTDLNRGETLGIEYGPLHTNRLRRFGGSTGHWTGVCRRLDPGDLEGDGLQRAWPIAWDELARWYPAAEQTVQIASDWDTEAVAQQLGRPLLPLDPAQLVSTHYLLSPPTRFGDVYRDELVEHPKVAVHLHANLTHIQVGSDAGRVTGLELATLEGGAFRARAQRYVLATGGLENARLLLLSRDRNPAGLGNANGYVGRFFMEHPHFQKAGYLLLDPSVDIDFYRTRSALDTSRFPSRVMGALMPSPELVRRGEILPMACTFTPKLLGVADAKGRTGAVPGADIAQLVWGKPNAALYGVFVRSAQEALAESRVTLGEERDALGLPRIALRWQLGPRDREFVVDFLRLLGAEMARRDLGRVWIDADSEGELATLLEGGSHHMGTTRMSASPREGVVDERCRLHEASNLYVAGSSVFPSIGLANPTLTIVALAHRMADDLRRELQG